VLQRLAKEYRLYIVSNCLAGYIENFLQMYRLDALFTDHECSGFTGKPKGENIAMIIMRNELKSPLYIGDTPGDFAASAENRMPFIHAGYGFGKVPGAEWKVSGLGELGEVLRQINSTKK
jgi:phosphoglycolate phosphatase